MNTPLSFLPTPMLENNIQFCRCFADVLVLNVHLSMMFLPYLLQMLTAAGGSNYKLIIQPKTLSQASSHRIRIFVYETLTLPKKNKSSHFPSSSSVIAPSLLKRNCIYFRVLGGSIVVGKTSFKCTFGLLLLRNAPHVTHCA